MKLSFVIFCGTSKAVILEIPYRTLRTFGASSNRAIGQSTLATYFGQKLLRSPLPIVETPLLMNELLGLSQLKFLNPTIQQAWARMDEYNLPLYVGSNEVAVFPSFGLYIKINGLPVSMPIVTAIPLGWLSKLTDEDNVHMQLEEAITGSIWSGSYVKYIGDNSEIIMEG